MKKNGAKMLKSAIPDLDAMPYLMNLEQISGLTGFAVETVKRYCQRGTIPAIKIGKEWRVSKPDFIKFTSQQ